MKREEEKKARALVVQPRPEILPPASRVPALPALDLEAMQLPDLSNLKQQIRNAAEMLDLSVPEGLLDKWFGRPDHRIEVKTERGPLLAGYVIACTAVWEAARAHQNTCHQIYLDRLLFQRALDGSAEPFMQMLGQAGTRRLRRKHARPASSLRSARDLNVQGGCS